MVTLVDLTKPFKIYDYSLSLREGFIYYETFANTRFCCTQFEIKQYSMKYR